jgi:hypothetical protein
LNLSSSKKKAKTPKTPSTPNSTRAPASAGRSDESNETDAALHATSAKPLFSIPNIETFLLTVVPLDLNYTYRIPSVNKGTFVPAKREILAK